jgi:DNA-directed RNA polymerase specialized sigma24 family protein
MNSVDALLGDLGWLRTLARQLARDPELADEVVQDACSLALRQRQAPQQWRAWLTTVVRNLLHTHRRRRSAQQRRLAALARARADASTDDAQATLQRAEAQQRLAAVVLALDERKRPTGLTAAA